MKTSFLKVSLAALCCVAGLAAAPCCGSIPPSAVVADVVFDSYALQFAMAGATPGELQTFAAFAASANCTSADPDELSFLYASFLAEYMAEKTEGKETKKDTTNFPPGSTGTDRDASTR